MVRWKGRFAPVMLLTLAGPVCAIAAAARPVSYQDLIGIVDIGISSSSEFEGFSVSPDGRHIAFQTIRQNLARNEVELRWTALEVADPHRVVDLGPAGEPIPDLSVPKPVGTVRAERPAWLDSQHLLYRARFNNSTQIWLRSIDAKTTRQLTHAPVEIVAFGLSRERSHLFYATSVSRRIEVAGEYPEIDRGFLYDDRFATLASLRPRAQHDRSAEEVWVLRLSDGSARRASEAEANEFRRSDTVARGASGRSWLREAPDKGSAAWLQMSDSAYARMLPARLIWQQGGSRETPCLSERCEGHFKGVWLDDDGQNVYFLRWEDKHDYGAVGLYSWRIGTQAVRRIMRTEDLLQYCARAGQVLICQQESATNPGKIVSVSLADGGRQVLYDPNPDFGTLQLGRVKALSWKDGNGVEGFGHFVEPPGVRSGTRCPLVIVQYRSRGFLRGGVGDEFPIHVMAAKGLCVLSFHRPDDWELFARSKSLAEGELESWRQQRDRRRVLSVLKEGIALLERRGAVDPRRIGISGLSDGANTANFALIHEPRLFSVAAVAWTYWNPILYDLIGPQLLPKLQWFDLDNPRSESGEEQWRQLSVAMNAARIQAPLLVQVSDSELLPETQTANELRRFHKPFEMHVFANEYHIKSQPRHKASVYKRGVQWFLFWLADREEPDPVDVDQYTRWRKMKIEIGADTSVG